MSDLIRNQVTLTLKLAMQATQAALQCAEHAGVRISIAVVNAGGQLIHMAHMDHAPLLSRDIALHKALTAHSFNTATGDWQARLARCSDAVRQGLPLQPNLALFGGGEPLLAFEQTIGAIGISGASETIDCECARAAQAHVKALLAQA